MKSLIYRQWLKGDIVISVMKITKHETNAEINIPLFINIDDNLNIEEYIQRV